MCIVFSLILLYYQPFLPLCGKSRKCFLLFGTSSCDELVGNCCCCCCSCWWFFRLISQKTLLIAQNWYWFCSWKAFFMWHNSFCKCSFVEQIPCALLTYVRRVPIFNLLGACDVQSKDDILSSFSTSAVNWMFLWKLFSFKRTWSMESTFITQILS